MNKMIRTIGKTMLPIAMVSVLFTSCDDFLTITPLNAVVVENFWEKESEVESAVASCYYNMQNPDFTKRVIAWGEFRADNITENSELTKNEELYNYYINNVTPSNSWTSWAAMYDVINLCNTVLHYAPQAQAKDGNFSIDELHAYEAEALSIRALCYFYLIRSFQKVPLVTWATIGDDEDFKVPASTEEKILTQIISDLEWSLKYIWSNTFFDDNQERKGRFSTNSVYALLADIHLWKGNYQLCADYCSKILDYKMKEYKAQQEEMLNGNYELYATNGYLTLYEGYPLLNGTGSSSIGSSHYAYQMLFYMGNSFESILELQYDYESRNEGNEGMNLFYGDLKKIGSGVLSAASYLTNQGESDVFADKNDCRLIESTGYDGVTVQQSYPICKYRVPYGNGSTSLRSTPSNWVIYRLTDIMLMRAEALAYLGGDDNKEEAYKIVKAVNARSCLGTSKLTYDKDRIKELILEERQREFLYEGKRWYDLMRMVRHADNPAQAMSILRNTYLLRKYQKNGKDAVARLGSVNNLFLPIAQTEIDVNPLLEPDQNPAYIY